VLLCTLGTLRPRVVLHVFLRLDESACERLSARFIPDETVFDISQTDTLEPRRGAFQVMRLLAI
jgi:hypothetical protein